MRTSDCQEWLPKTQYLCKKYLVSHESKKKKCTSNMSKKIHKRMVEGRYVFKANWNETKVTHTKEIINYLFSIIFVWIFLLRLQVHFFSFDLWEIMVLLTNVLGIW